MTPEVLSLLGGGLSGFIFKLIGSMAEAQQRNLQAMLDKQKAADESANQAAARGGVWVRRGIVATILFAVVVAPFIVSFTDIGVTIPVESGILFWKKMTYQTVQGLLVHESVVQALYAIIGFYFGSSQIK